MSSLYLAKRHSILRLSLISASNLSLPPTPDGSPMPTLSVKMWDLTFLDLYSMIWLCIWGLKGFLRQKKSSTKVPKKEKKYRKCAEILSQLQTHFFDEIKDGNNFLNSYAFKICLSRRFQEGITLVWYFLFFLKPLQLDVYDISMIQQVHWSREVQNSPGASLK